MKFKYGTKKNQLDTTNLIYSDSTQSGHWLDVELPDGLTTAHLEKLFDFYVGVWTVRNVSGMFQVLCLPKDNDVDLLKNINQRVTDLHLRELISKRSIVQADTLVGSVLCHLVKY